MQSAGSETLLHSCFDSLKTAVMGCCYSICHKENDPQQRIINERTHLLEVTEQHQEPVIPTVYSSSPPRKPDEQSALSRILHETANNVIDVGALGGYLLEPGAYSERVRAYTLRLTSAGAPAPKPPRILSDVSHAERTNILSGPPLSNEDKDLISNSVKKAAAAISELRVEHHEDLVVPFGVP